MLPRGNSIGRLLHYTKNSLSSPCTSLHKHEQKDRTKTLPSLQTISILTLLKPIGYWPIGENVSRFDIFKQTKYLTKLLSIVAGGGGMLQFSIAFVPLCVKLESFFFKLNISPGLGYFNEKRGI